MARQAVVSRIVRQDVSDDVVRLAADGGLGERLVRYIDVTNDEGAIQALARFKRGDEPFTERLRALELYRGAEAFLVANTLGRTAQLARLGARQLVRSVDEFGEAAYTGLRRGLSPLSGASQFAVARQLRDLSPETRELIADGGTSEQAVDFLARTGNEGATVIADGGDDAIEVIRRFESVDDDTANQLSELRQAETIDTSDLNRLENAIDAGQINADELRRISRLLSEDADFRYDDGVTIDDILELAESDDLSDTVGVVSSSNTITVNGRILNTVQLDSGDAATGRTHLRLRHIGGVDRKDRGEITTFWPLGQRIDSRELANVLDVPSEVDDIIYRAIRNGDATEDGGNVLFRYNVDDTDGIDTVCVRVNPADGRVLTAYPHGTGSAVDTYFGSPANRYNIRTIDSC